MNIFFLLLLSFTAFAQNEEECVPPGLPSEAAQLRAVMAPLTLWVMTDQQMQNAPCKTKTPPTMHEMDQEIAAYSNGTRETKVISGVTLTDDPRMLKMFESLSTRWITPTIRDSSYQPNFQNQFNLNPACENVTCAMEKVWGTALSKQMSYLYLHFGFNSSEYSFPDSDRFTVDEMNNILIGLKDFPSHLSPLANNRQLTHYTRGKWSIRPGTYGDSAMEVFDPWTRTNPMQKQQTIFHEMCHILAEKGGLDRSQAWLNLSGWELQGDNWKATRPACMVSKYGSKNPVEDFAETAVAYRYHPIRLYKSCPEKYQFMKKIFHGVEYFAEASCVETAQGAPVPPAVPQSPVAITVHEAAKPRGPTAEANPPAIPVEDNLDWTRPARICSRTFYTSRKSTLSNCMVNSMVSSMIKDQDIPSDQRRELAQQIKAMPSTQAAIASEKKKIYAELQKHFSAVNHRLKTLHHWQSMSPEVFCQSTYARPSRLLIQNHSISAHKILHKLQARCVKLQSTRSQRFMLTEKSL